MSRDQFTFDASFQDLILASFIRHPNEFLKFGQVLKPSYFEGVHATTVAYAVFDYIDKRGKCPGWSLLPQLAKDRAAKLEMNDDSATINDYVERLRDIDTSDHTYVAERVVSFARERATILAIKKSVAMIQERNLPDDGFVPMFEEALRIGQNLDDMGLLIHRDAEEIIKKVTSTTYGVKTGFPAWDRLWHNGWGPGWLIALVAPPKRYKTALCINLALNMVSPAYGYDVLYYPCEITQELAALRMFQRMTGTKLSEIYDSPNQFIGTLTNAINTTMSGNLVVKGYPANGVTLATIRTHAKMAKDYFKLKKLGAIVIDYADTVRPTGTFDREDLAQKAIYEQARAIGFELGCPVIMPDRMTAAATEQVVPDMRSFQGAFAKGGVVDVAIGLCANDDEYRRNILRTFVFFNRHGAAGKHFRGSVDPEIMNVEIGEEIEYDAEATSEEESEHNGRRRRGGGGRSRRERDLPEELRDGGP
jgi:hypothetical protein